MVLLHITITRANWGRVAITKQYINRECACRAQDKITDALITLCKLRVIKDYQTAVYK